MRKTFKLLCLLLIAVLGINTSFAQKVTLDNVLQVKLNNNGSIYKNHELVGYYFFYNVDKVDKKNNEYLLKIMDPNFKEIGSTSLVTSKSVSLREVEFSGDVFVLKMTDPKEKQEVLYFYNTEGKQISKLGRPINSVEVYFQTTPEYDNIASLNALEGIGFCDHIYTRQGNKGGYEIRFYGNDGALKWTQAPETGFKMNESAEYFGESKTQIFSLVYKKKNAMSQDADQYILANDITTGKRAYEALLKDDQNELVPYTGYFDEVSGQFLVFGTYFAKGDNTFKGKSLGLFSAKLGSAGELKDKKLVSWGTDVSKFVPVNEKGKLKDVGYMFFHRIFTDSDGKIYAVAEQFKKNADGLGIASAILSGGRNTQQVVEILTDDLMLFTFEKDFKLTDVKIYDKAKSHVHLPPGAQYLSTQVLGHLIKSMGDFDYRYTSQNKDKMKTTIGYTDYDRKSTEGKWSFNSISINKGAITVDKINLPKNKATFSRILPSRQGQVAIMEYYRKEKRLELRIEKLN